MRVITWKNECYDNSTNGQLHKPTNSWVMFLSIYSITCREILPLSVSCEFCSDRLWHIFSKKSIFLFFTSLFLVITITRVCHLTHLQVTPPWRSAILRIIKNGLFSRTLQYFFASFSHKSFRHQINILSIYFLMERLERSLYRRLSAGIFLTLQTPKAQNIENRR